ANTLLLLRWFSVSIALIRISGPSCDEPAPEQIHPRWYRDQAQRTVPVEPNGWTQVPHERRCPLVRVCPRWTEHTTVCARRLRWTCGFPRGRLSREEWNR